MYIIIPARFESKRFPGKPLALINGIPIIQHTWNNAIKVTENVVIATDNLLIYDRARKFGATVIMTDACENGTERVYEAASMMTLTDDELIINLQSDEPYLRSADIRYLSNSHVNQVSTLHYVMDDPSEHRVKMIINKSFRAIYFTRHHLSLNIHVGIYAFRMHTLRMYHQFKKSPMEEGLEQMRFIDNDIAIYTHEIPYTGHSIDVPEDL